MMAPMDPRPAALLAGGRHRGGAAGLARDRRAPARATGCRPSSSWPGMLGVSRGTLRTALDRLEEAGEITRRQGSRHLRRPGRAADRVPRGPRGAAPLLRAGRAARRRAERARPRDRRAARSAPRPARRSGSTRTTPAWTITRTILADGEPVALMRDVVRPGVALPPAQAAARARSRAARWCSTCCSTQGVPVAFAVTRVRPRLLSGRERAGRALGVQGATAVLELEEIMHLGLGRGGAALLRHVRARRDRPAGAAQPRGRGARAARARRRARLNPDASGLDVGDPPMRSGDAPGASIVPPDGDLRCTRDPRASTPRPAARSPATSSRPADPEWDLARRAWNLAVDQRPALVAAPGRRRRRGRHRRLRAAPRPEGRAAGHRPQRRGDRLARGHDPRLHAAHARRRDRRRGADRARAGRHAVARGHRGGDAARPVPALGLLAGRRRRRLHARRRPELARPQARPRRQQRDRDRARHARRASSSARPPTSTPTCSGRCAAAAATSAS